MKYVVQRIKSLKKQWAGHVARKINNRWSITTTSTLKANNRQECPEIKSQYIEM